MMLKQASEIKIICSIAVVQRHRPLCGEKWWKGSETDRWQSL